MKIILFFSLIFGSFLFSNEVRAVHEKDVLFGQEVTYSGVEGGKVDEKWKYPEFVGENVVDGNDNTRWSAEKKDEQWLIIKNKDVKDISQIMINFYAMPPDFNVQVSLDGVNYRNIFNYKDKNPKNSNGISEIKNITFDKQKVQYIKYQQNKMWKHTNEKYYGSSIIEIEAYENSRDLEEITFDEHNIKLLLGQKKQLTYSYHPSDIELTNDKLKWESSNPSVVSVDENGYVEALAIGDATISLIFEGRNIRDDANIKVDSPNKQYDKMLTRWKDRLLGDKQNSDDPDIVNYIKSIDTESQELWKNLNKSEDRTYLWEKKESDTTSADYTTQFTNIKKLTLAYYKKGTTLYNNPDVISEIVNAISFMIDEKKYNGRYWTGNWWDWQIGSAHPLTDTLVLLHDDLVSVDYRYLEKFVAPLNGYASHPTKRWPNATATGANLADISIVILGSGVLLQDSSKIEVVAKELPSILKLVNLGDGLYLDGSLVQHNFFAYNGSYGNELLKGVGRIQSILRTTDWEIKDDNMNNLFNTVAKGYLELMTSGKMPSMFSGRSISREPGLNPFTTELETGKETIANLLLIAKFAPSDLQQKIKSYVKNWLFNVGNQYNFYKNPRDFEALMDLKNIMNDDTIDPYENKQILNIYASMDRVFQKTNNYSVGLSMYSNRIANYEYINTENGKGWHTGDGMLYLYTSDLGQFDEGYWPTIDSYRLPGTTVDTANLSEGKNTKKRSKQKWVGGVTDGKIGAVGMSLDKSNENSNLKALKSWFLLEDEIINLGSGINGTSDATIEQVIENRMISNDDKYSEIRNKENRVININQKDGNIGYIIPNSMNDIQIIKEANSASYKDINKYFYTDKVYTNHYLKILKNYGKSPVDETYEYTIIPNKSDAEISSIAQNINYKLLANTVDIQAIEVQDYLMANIWKENQEINDIVINHPMSIIKQKIGDNEYKIYLSNPKQDNSTISLEFKNDITEVLSSDDQISVSGNMISLDTNELYGASKSVTVKIKENKIQQLKLSTSSLEILKKKKTLTVKAYDLANGDEVEDIKWEIDKPEIANIDNFGTITAKRNGTTKITATTNNDVTESFVLRVTN